MRFWAEPPYAGALGRTDLHGLGSLVQLGHVASCGWKVGHREKLCIGKLDRKASKKLLVIGMFPKMVGLLVLDLWIIDA